MPRKGEAMSQAQREKLSAAWERRPRNDAEWYAQSAEKRFAKSVREGPVPDFRPELGPCLIFTGATNTSGYGQFRYQQKNGYAHRYAWERVNGEIPAGLTIDHLCRVRRCVNVEHLEVVDGPTNTRRAAEARDTCSKGHPYPPKSEWSNTKRRCPICYRETARKSWNKRSRSANGLPNRRIKYDQAKVRALIAQVRAGGVTISQASSEIGCNPNYLGRRTWEETRKDVLARDSSACLRCGAGADDVHHRLPRGLGGSTRPLISFGMANLVSLCRPCHRHIESEREESLRLGWLLERGVADSVEIPVLHWRLGPVLLGHDGSVTEVGRAA